jgi:hypothetical protein
MSLRAVAWQSPRKKERDEIATSLHVLLAPAAPRNDRIIYYRSAKAFAILFNAAAVKVFAPF